MYLHYDLVLTILLPSLSPTEHDKNGTSYLNSCQLPVLFGSPEIPDAIFLSSSKQSTAEQRYCRTVLAHYTNTGRTRRHLSTVVDNNSQLPVLHENFADRTPFV